MFHLVYLTDDESIVASVMAAAAITERLKFHLSMIIISYINLEIVQNVFKYSDRLLKH